MGKGRWTVTKTIGEYLNRKLNIMTWGQPSATFEGDEVFLGTWGGEKSRGAILPIGSKLFYCSEA